MKRNLHILLLIFGLYLGLHNGFLSILQEGNTTPVETFPYHIRIYPQTDKITLEKGIEYRNQRELSQLIEDFMS